MNSICVVIMYDTFTLRSLFYSLIQGHLGDQSELRVIHHIIIIQWFIDRKDLNINNHTLYTIYAERSVQNH